ncbi:MAG: dihydrofolate reductase [Candidatus Parcubacteria bacterium]|nr:dihydrofolate reductase [Candidatus Parcubacteria bacterium]
MKQIVCIIVAADKNRVIGNKGKIPWYLPADLAYFKKVTGTRPIIMGRKTHESIGRVLPGRKNIVISSQKDYKPIDSAMLAGDLKEALKIAGSGKVFVIGGAQVYREAIPFVDRIYATLINKVFNGDTFFPKLDRSEWREINREIYYPDKDNPYWFVWKVYERIKK